MATLCCVLPAISRLLPACDDWAVHAGPEVTAENCIVDRNAAIGRGVSLINKDKVKEADRSKDGFVITDGIITVLNGAIIQPGTTI